MCTRKNLTNQLTVIKNYLRKDGYPQNVIEKFDRTNKRADYDTVEKKTCFIHLCFGRNHLE